MLPPNCADSTVQSASHTAEAGGTPARARPRHHKSRGQSLVEFAVLLPMLVFILALAADFGRSLTAYIAISSAAREGAAYGMMSPANASNTTEIQKAALADAPTIWGTAPVVTSDATKDDAQGYDMVSVTVNYTFKPLIPLKAIPPFPSIPSSINLSRTVSMRVLN
jgi:Flp pilus assembly protein TadG